MKLRKIAAAIGAAGLLSMGMTSVASAEPVSDDAPELCPVTHTWTSKSYLRPGGSDIEEREKDRPMLDSGLEAVDIAIDGWTGGVPQSTPEEHRVYNEEGVLIGVDGWEYSNAPNFRVVFGTRIQLDRIDNVDIRFYTEESQTPVNVTRAALQTEGWGATPEELKNYAPDALQPSFEGNVINWGTATASASLAPFNTALLSAATVKPEGGERIVAHMTVTVTDLQPCPQVEENVTVEKKCVDGTDGLAVEVTTTETTTTPYTREPGEVEWVLDTENATTEVTVVEGESFIDEECRSPQPEDKVIEGEWSEVARKCVDTKAGIAEVTSERTVTTIPFVWDDITLTWMADEANAVETTESKTEKVDDASCVEKGGVTPTPDKPVKPQPPVDGDDLPDTGADMTTFGLSALGLLAVGGAAVMFARRRASN